MAETRKIAAILVADIVGYSRMAGADEDRTLTRLRGLRSDLLDPAIGAHGGRMVKWTGDGAIVEFRSVVDAVRCALEVQNGMAERNTGLPPQRRIDFRIGIHLGDVVEEADGDLMGDGVNVAARLEGVCEPGGVCLSEQAHSLVKGRHDIETRDLGPIRLKNIADPVRVFSLQVGLPLRARAVVTPKPPERRRRLKPVLAGMGIAAALALALTLIGGWFGWVRWPALHEPDPSVAALGDKLATTPRLSIAVLPFEASNGDPDQQRLTDVFAAGLTTGLSQLKGAFVLAPAAGSVSMAKPVDAQRIGRELGVRFALAGSIRSSGEAVGVSAELFSTETGTQMWSGRVDGERSQLSKMQDDLVARLANALGAEQPKPASPPALREHAAGLPASGADQRADRIAAQPAQHQAASPAPQAASEPPSYCGTPLACRRNGGVYHPLSSD
jgi:adenylate cyclase